MNWQRLANVHLFPILSQPGSLVARPPLARIQSTSHGQNGTLARQAPVVAKSLAGACQSAILGAALRINCLNISPLLLYRRSQRIAVRNITFRVVGERTWLAGCATYIAA